MRSAIIPSRLALIGLATLAPGVPAQAQGGPRTDTVGLGSLVAPRVVATGTRIPLRGAGVTPRARVTIERARRGRGWRALAAVRADRRGSFRVRVRPRRLASRYRLRAVVAGAVRSRTVRVRSRDVTLDAVGDVNMGDGVADVMEVRGFATRGAVSLASCGLPRWRGAGRGRPQPCRRPQAARREAPRLRIAFVGFSDVNPAGFGAGPRRPGTVLASPGRVVQDVRRAARGADVVIATFHWGVERSSRPSSRQRALARAALAGGARAVIGAHPHVLQPIVRRGRRVVAYSLGNFVWSAGSEATTRTGILRLRLSTRGVEGLRFLPARISGTRPALIGRARQRGGLRRLSRALAGSAMLSE